MSDDPHKTVSKMAGAYVRAAQVSGIALQGVLPILLGYWGDVSLGTRPWLLIVGAGLGFSLLLMSVKRISQVSSSSGRNDKTK